MTGPSPVDHGKPGSKVHVVSDPTGLPLAVGVPAVNLYDSRALQPMVMAIPRVRSRRGPRRFRPAKPLADKAYDSDHHRRWLRRHGIVPRIAREGVESRTGWGGTAGSSNAPSPGSPATAASPSDTKRRADTYCGFPTLAAALTCFKRLAKPTT